MSELKQMFTIYKFVFFLTIYTCINMVNSEVMTNNLVNISISEKYVAVGNRFNVTCNSSRKTYKLGIDQGVNLITVVYTDDSGKFILKPDMRLEKSRFRAAFPSKLNRTQDFVSITFVSEPAETDFSGQYVCFGTDKDNKNEQRSSLVKLLIGYKPQKLNFTVIVKGKKRHVFKENDELKINCNTRINSSTNGTLGLFYNNILDKTVKPVVKQKIYTIEKTLYLNKPASYDGKIIKCIAQNNYGTVEKKVILKVKYKPREKLIFANNKVASEFNLTSGKHITCSAKGNPKPDVEWVVYDKIIFKKVQGMSNVLVSKKIQKEFAKFTLECSVIQNETETIVSKQFVVTLHGKKSYACLIIGLVVYGIIDIIFVCYIVWRLRSYICEKFSQIRKPFFGEGDHNVDGGCGTILLNVMIFIFAFTFLGLFAPLVLLVLICNRDKKKYRTCCQFIQESPNAGYESVDVKYINGKSGGEDETATHAVGDRTDGIEYETPLIDETAEQAKTEEQRNRRNELENENIDQAVANESLKKEIEEKDLKLEDEESLFKNLQFEMGEKDQKICELEAARLSQEVVGKAELKEQLEQVVAERDRLQKKVNRLLKQIEDGVQQVPESQKENFVYERLRLGTGVSIETPKLEHKVVTPPISIGTEMDYSDLSV